VQCLTSTNTQTENQASLLSQEEGPQLDAHVAAIRGELAKARSEPSPPVGMKGKRGAKSEVGNRLPAPGPARVSP